MIRYDATPNEYADLDEEHEELCCDDHHAHHEFSPCSEWPIGGCWTCEAIVLRTCQRLASNLAQAGALCQSHMSGIRYAVTVESNVIRSRAGRAPLDQWFPGCGFEMLPTPPALQPSREGE